jgi:hypothetical protein
MTSPTIMTSNLSQALRTSIVAPIKCRDELVQESDDEEEIDLLFAGNASKVSTVNQFLVAAHAV